MFLPILFYILFCLIVIWPVVVWSIYWQDSDNGRRTIQLTVGFFITTFLISMVPVLNAAVFLIGALDAASEISKKTIPVLTNFLEKPVLKIKGKNDGQV